MRATLQSRLTMPSHSSGSALSHGVKWGLVGGFVGTVVMDLVLFGALWLAGLPPVISFTTIGDTAAGFFALLGIAVPGGVAMGAFGHYALGLGLGALFGAGVSQIYALRLDTLKKGLILGVVYIEILSQPILALSPIILKMDATQTVQWFVISFFMHLIWGAVLGVIVSTQSRPARLAKRG